MMGFINLVFYTAVIGPSSIDPRLLISSQNPHPVAEGNTCFIDFTCQNLKTFLYCERGVCVCPRDLTEEVSGLPLNMVWDPVLERCVSQPGSFCNLHQPPVPFTKAVCRNYAECKAGGQGQNVAGVCSGSEHSVTAVLASVMILSSMAVILI